jgi:Flp pilus assembly pilin Flp
MRSTSRQSGQTLVEAMVAIGLVAIAVVAGLQTLDAAVLGARSATHQAWARCVARGELEAISASSWSDGAYPAPNQVSADVAWSSGTGGQAVQKVLVLVRDPITGMPLVAGETYQVYKSAALAGGRSMAQADLDAIQSACSGLLGT